MDNNSENDFVINMKLHKFEPLMCLSQMNIAALVLTVLGWVLKHVKMAIIINWMAHGLDQQTEEI